MAFVETGATIVLEATLTNYGKKKLYESIEGGDVGSFITKFTIGDSDSNYRAILGGITPLDFDSIPIPGDFKPSSRSFALYKGTYKPGGPIILKDGDEDDLTREFSIAGNLENSMSFQLHTEWPAGEVYPEEYGIEIIGPSYFEESRWAELFTYRLIGTTNGQTLEITFHGGLNLAELQALTGGQGTLESDFYVRIFGMSTNKFTKILFTVTAN